MNEEQKQIIIGSMLGDGCFERHKHTTNLKIQRSIKDIDYLIWEQQQLYPYAKEIKFGESFDKRTLKTYKYCSLRTSSSKKFLKIYNQWYLNKKKIVPIDLELTPLIISVWFADDGCVIRRWNKNKTYFSLNLKLATHGFSKDENQFLANLLNKRYNCESFKIVPDNNNYYIQCNTHYDTKNFIKEIDEKFPLNRKSELWRDSNSGFWVKKIKIKCKFCFDENVYKNGTVNGKQKMYCKNCKKQFYVLQSQISENSFNSFNSVKI